MESFPTISQRLSAIPRLVWFVSLVVVASLVAIFMLNFAVGAVAGYALFALFCGSHFFMHGSHGAEHKDHPPSNTTSTASPKGQPRLARRKIGEQVAI